MQLNLKKHIVYGLILMSLISLEAQQVTALPNFIFYLADDQDQLDYGVYGNPKVHTPAVDALANEGMRFTNFYTSQAICAPSRSQIFTGMFPFKNGCMANHLPVKPNIKTVIDYMESAGYDVVLAGKGHVKPNSVFQWSKYFMSVNHRYLPLEELDDYLQKTKKPFCVFVTSDYPHGPYPETSNYSKKDIYKLPYDRGNFKNFKTGYYQNIEDDNTQLERVLKMVDSYGLKDNSVFIYASDHGISGKWGVAEQGLKVPFVVRWPGVVASNSVSESLLNFVDVLPTFLDIIGAKIPESIDGKSFYSILKGNNQTVHKFVYSLATKQNIQQCKVFPTRAIRNSRYKFIRNYNSVDVVASNYGANPVINKFIKKGADSFPNVPFEELYDLENDPYQSKNLINKSGLQEVKKELSDALQSWMEDQNDFLVYQKMPLLKPTLHPLDRNSKWNKVSSDIEEKLNENDYYPLHY